MSAIDTEIERHRVAMLRHEAALSVLRESARGACCPSCFHGAVYTAAAERQERCGETMMRLLLKRAHGDDAALAEAIRVEAWP